MAAAFTYAPTATTVQTTTRPQDPGKLEAQFLPPHSNSLSQSLFGALLGSLGRKSGADSSIFGRNVIATVIESDFVMSRLSLTCANLPLADVPLGGVLGPGEAIDFSQASSNSNGRGLI